MTDMAKDIFSIGRIYHSLFRNDSRDQSVRRDIEGRIENFHAFRRQWFAEEMRNFSGVTLLNRNITAPSTFDIDGRDRSGDVKRNSVAFGQYGNGISADLVCDIAIGGNPVATHHH